MQPLHLAIFVIFAVAGVSVLGHKTQQNILKPNTSSTQWLSGIPTMVKILLTNFQPLENLGIRVKFTHADDGR